MTDEAIDEIARQGYDPQLRRPAAKARDPAADSKTRWRPRSSRASSPKGSAVRIDFRDGEFTFERLDHAEAVAT